eukprot:1269313-Rhodomonas_salina.1
MCGTEVAYAAARTIRAWYWSEWWTLEQAGRGCAVLRYGKLWVLGSGRRVRTETAYGFKLGDIQYSSMGYSVLRSGLLVPGIPEIGY